MKLAIVLVCCLIGLASCNVGNKSGYTRKHLIEKMKHVVVHNKDLGTILDELSTCFDTEALQNWIIEKWTTDEDFQKVITYLQSDHFKVIDEHIFQNEWINNHLVYLEDNGVKVYETLNALRDFLGLPPLEPPMAHVSYGLKSPIAPPDIEWDLLHLFVEFWHLTKGSIVCILETLYKYKEDPALLDLLTQYEDPAFKEFLDYVWEKQEVKELFDLIQSGNLDLEYILAVASRLLGLACSENTPLDRLYRMHGPPKSHRAIPLRVAQMMSKYGKYNKI